jgi:hypothetical protein
LRDLALKEAPGMPAHKTENRSQFDLFEKIVLNALKRVKDGSITVIKQDNIIIQVNISENLDWSGVTQAGYKYLRVLP